MKQYGWAVNSNKLQRAIAKGGDEEQVKDEYVKLGGKVIPGYVFVKEEPVIEEKVEEAPEIIEEPVKEEVKPAVKKVIKK